MIKLRGVQSACQRVEIAEARLDAAGQTAMREPRIDPRIAALQHFVNLRELADPLVLQNAKDLLFRACEHVAGVARLIKRIAEDFRAGVDQGPQRRLVADDICVVRGIGRGGNRLSNLGQINRPSPTAS